MIRHSPPPTEASPFETSEVSKKFGNLGGLRFIPPAREFIPARGFPAGLAQSVPWVPSVPESPSLGGYIFQERRPGTGPTHGASGEKTRH